MSCAVRHSAAVHHRAGRTTARSTTRSRYAFVVNGFLCALVIGPLLGGIGTMVVAKRMAFFSQAVGNAALTGVAIGVIIGESYTAPYMSMFSFCLLFGLLLNFARNRTKMSADTLIGVFLSISLAIGATTLLWVSAKVNTHILDTVMFGSILTVNDTDMTVLLVTTLLTAVTALPLFNQMLLASLNPSLAHVRGVRVHLLEYVFVLLADDPDGGLREDRRRRARRSAAADPGRGRAQPQSLAARLRALEHRVLDRELPRRHLRADALGPAAAVGRRDHPDRGRALHRHDGRPHGAAALSRGEPMRPTCASASAAAACLSLLASGRRAARPRTPPAPPVLTGTQATYSLTVALTAGTPIESQNVPADGRQLSLLKDYIERRMDALAPTFAAATAVVTLTNALPGDPLYRFAREANIRIVDIEAAVPWSLDAPGVALADTPASNVDWGGDTDRRDGRRAVFLAQRLERDPHGRHHRARSRRRCSRTRPRRSARTSRR